MLGNRLFYLAMFLFLVVQTRSVRAEDQCKEVLAGGAFKTISASRSVAFDEFLYMQALQKNYEESKKETVAGMNIPKGKALLGANYSNDDWTKKQVEIQNTLAQNIHFSDLEQTLLSEGDANILDAWKACIARGKGGVSARYESAADPDGKEGIFVLEYIKPTSMVSPEFAVLNRSVEHSGALVKSGAWCLEASYKLVAGAPCRAKLVLTSASSTITLLIDSTIGSAEVSLPPRLKHVKTAPVDYPIDYSDHHVTAYFESKLNRAWRPQGAIALNAAQVARGCAFVKSTASVLGPIYDPKTNTPPEANEYCRDAKVDRASESDLQFSFEYSNLSKAYVLACHVEPHIQYVRDFWTARDQQIDASACLPTKL